MVSLSDCFLAHKRVRRLCEEIELEARYWQRGLDIGIQRESIDRVKRRISRLRGALGYQGIVGDVKSLANRRGNWDEER